jgi:hypothetical protein
MSCAPLTVKHLNALHVVARGEVFPTYNSTAFKITGPCSSKLLWSLARMDLISDPPGGPLPGCHCMLLTAKGAEALRAATSGDARNLGALPGAPATRT